MAWTNIKKSIIVLKAAIIDIFKEGTEFYNKNTEQFLKNMKYLYVPQGSQRNLQLQAVEQVWFESSVKE